MDKEIQSIRFFSTAIIATEILFGGIALYLHKIGHVPIAPGLDPVIGYAGIIIAAAFISLSFLLFKKRSDAAASAGKKEKMGLFRSAVMLQYALMNGSAVFNIIAYLLNGNNQSLIIAACCIIVMLIQFPSEEKYNRFGG